MSLLFATVIINLKVQIPGSQTFTISSLCHSMFIDLNYSLTL